MSIPNYISTQAAPTHDPDHLGQAVPENIGVHPDNVPPPAYTDARTFVYPAQQDTHPLDVRRHVHDQVAQYHAHLNNIFHDQYDLPKDFAPSYPPNFFMHPVDERTEAKDFVDAYVASELANSHSYVMKLRAPSL